MSITPVILDEVRCQLQRFALDSRFLKAFIPRIDCDSRSTPDTGETAKSLSARYLRMGSMKALRRHSAEVIRDVTNGDIDHDELVQAYAQRAVAVLNEHLVGAVPMEMRDLLTMVAALATAIYSFWTPTIKVSGCEGMTHLQVKQRLSSTSWISWYEVREYAPVIIGKTGGPRSIRTPLHQFLIHLRLRSVNPTTADEAWKEIRTISHDARWGITDEEHWSDLVNTESVSRQKCQRWMRGAVAIPHTFIVDEKCNPHCVESLTREDRLRFSTIRTIQLLWGICANRMPQHHDLLAHVFSEIISIPYEGRLIS